MPTFNCGAQGSGSLLISNDQYSDGEFEFKIQPSLINGQMTVFGLADDGDSPKN